MREILFKAKTTKKLSPIHEFNEKWVEGNLIKSDGRYYIHPLCNRVKMAGELGKIIVMHEVQPNTICQHTGLSDRNGQKIWENDICIIEDGTTFDDGDGYFKVGFDEDSARFTLDGDGLTVDFDNVYSNDTEVLGNIFDNLELLEVDYD